MMFKEEMGNISKGSEKYRSEEQGINRSFSGRGIENRAKGFPGG